MSWLEANSDSELQPPASHRSWCQPASDSEEWGPPAKHRRSCTAHSFQRAKCFSDDDQDAQPVVPESNPSDSTQPRPCVIIDTALLKLQGGLQASQRREHLTSYEINGMSAERVKRVLSGPVCKCKKECHKHVKKKDLLNVCTWWHGHLHGEERRFLLHSLYETASLGSTSDFEQDEVHVARRTQWVLCGVEVCYVAFCILLGIGVKSGRKMAQGVVDMRRGLDQAPPPAREAKQTNRVHQFFLELYMSAAESLPHEHYMIQGGNSATQYHHDRHHRHCNQHHYHHCNQHLCGMNAVATRHHGRQC